jgi:hypothetical protein
LLNWRQNFVLKPKPEQPYVVSVSSVLKASNFFLPVMLLGVFRGEGEGEDAIQLALGCDEFPLLVVPSPSAAAWSIKQSHGDVCSAERNAERNEDEIRLDSSGSWPVVRMVYFGSGSH